MGIDVNADVDHVDQATKGKARSGVDPASGYCASMLIAKLMNIRFRSLVVFRERAMRMGSSRALWLFFYKSSSLLRISKNAESLLARRALGVASIPKLVVAPARQ